MEHRDVEIARIKVGTSLREDLGDIPALARTIEEHGQRPLVVRAIPESSDYELVIGLRVLRACQALGRTKVAVIVSEVADPLAAQLADNAHQKPYTRSEQVAIARLLFPEELEAAKARKGSGLKRGQTTPVREISPHGKGRTWDLIGQVLGTSGKSLQKALAVVEAAEKEPGLRYLCEEMDRDQKVDGPYQTVKAYKSGKSFEPNDQGHLVPVVVVTALDEKKISWQLTEKIRALTKRLKTSLPALPASDQQDLIGHVGDMLCELGGAWAVAKGITAAELQEKLCTGIRSYPYEP